MIRLTTPTHEILVENADLTGCDVYVTYRQGRREVTKRAEPVAGEEGTTLSVTLSQTETALFGEGKVSIQVNWVHPDGTRDATERLPVAVHANLLDREVEYGGQP